MRSLIPAVCLALAALTAAGAHGAEPPVALPPEIERVLRDYENAWQRKDTAALAALFAADGMALPNGDRPARGAAEIAAAYAKNAGTPLALRTLSFSFAGDMAYIVGGFASAAGQPDFGKFVLVLRRAPDGRWLIAADIDNMNALPRRS